MANAPEIPLEHVLRAQRLARRFLARKKRCRLLRVVEQYMETKEGRRLKRRFNVWHEIIETEKSYLGSLMLIIRKYKEPIQDEEILTPEEISNIFGNLEAVKELSKQLYHTLKTEVLPTTSGANIGKIFKGMLPFFKMYSLYCINYPKFFEAYNEAKHKKKFIALEKKYADMEDKGLDLSNLLILPVQRIPRYKLLFEQLKDTTPEEHHDYANICEALEGISAICTTMNEMKKNAESMNEVIRIQNSLVGEFKSLIRPSRLFVKEGPLMIYARKNPYMRDEELNGMHQLFVFNDLMVIAHPTTGLFKSGDKQQFVYDRGLLMDACGDIRKLNETSFVISYMSLRNEIKFVAATEQEAEEWVAAITETVQKVRAEGKRSHGYSEMDSGINLLRNALNGITPANNAGSKDDASKNGTNSSPSSPAQRPRKGSKAKEVKEKPNKMTRSKSFHKVLLSTLGVKSKEEKEKAQAEKVERERSRSLHKKGTETSLSRTNSDSSADGKEKEGISRVRSQSMVHPHRVHTKNQLLTNEDREKLRAMAEEKERQKEQGSEGTSPDVQKTEGTQEKQETIQASPSRKELTKRNTESQLDVKSASTDDSTSSSSSRKTLKKKNTLDSLPTAKSSSHYTQPTESSSRRFSTMRDRRSADKEDKKEKKEKSKKDQSMDLYPSALRANTSTGSKDASRKKSKLLDVAHSLKAKPTTTSTDKTQE